MDNQIHHLGGSKQSKKGLHFEQFTITYLVSHSKIGEIHGDKINVNRDVNSHGPASQRWVEQQFMDSDSGTPSSQSRSSLDVFFCGIGSNSLLPHFVDFFGCQRLWYGQFRLCKSAESNNFLLAGPKRWDRNTPFLHQPLTLLASWKHNGISSWLLSSDSFLLLRTQAYGESPAISFWSTNSWLKLV